MTVSKSEREEGTKLLPKFDANGLVAAVVIDPSDHTVLMLAFMNEEALTKTQETGIAHFYSRSRQSLWKKGETSGNVLRVESILVDCDQDAFVIYAHPAGPACHRGVRSCFYRKLEGDALVPVKT